MKNLLLLLLALSCPLLVQGVMFPINTATEILKCKDWGGKECNWDVQYMMDIELTDITPVIPPIPRAGYNIVPVGVHCQMGDPANNVPFSKCSFDGSWEHAPEGQMSRACKLKSLDSWELVDPYACMASGLVYGNHSGASPGAECVIFTQSGGWGSPGATTPYGRLDPLEVANSGNKYCQKPLPPDVTCDISLPSTIAHGTVPASGVSKAYIEGSVNCGTKPSIDFLGGNKLTLAPGVTTELEAVMPYQDHVIVTSTLTTVNARAGAYEASTVIVVSPY